MTRILAVRGGRYSKILSLMPWNCRVNVSNQNLKAAEAQFQQARAVLRYYRADYYPTVTAGPSATRTLISANSPTSTVLRGATYNDFVLPFDVSYQADVVGASSKKRGVLSGTSTSQCGRPSHGQPEHACDLAVDYFQARSLDAEEQLLNSTVKQYEQALELNESRFQGGIASEVEVEQAKTQLQTTRAAAIDWVSCALSTNTRLQFLLENLPLSSVFPHCRLPHHLRTFLSVCRRNCWRDAPISQPRRGG